MSTDENGKKKKRIGANHVYFMYRPKSFKNVLDYSFFLMNVGL